METIDGKKGKLELVLGGGWLSRHEASMLRPGLIIRSERLAGTGQELRLNGERMASCELMIFGAEGRMPMCPRISSLENQESPEPEPHRGAEMTELLPFSIVMGSAEASIADLSGLGRESVIDMGIDAEADENGSLAICGQEAARGKICVIGENMGLRLTSVTAAAAGGAEFRTTGNLLDGSYSAEKLVDYDFSRPDFFTRRQILALEDIHKDFLRSLASAAPGKFSGMRLTAVDQLNFQEYLEALAADGESIVVAPVSPLRKGSEPAMPAKPLLRLSSGAFPEKTALSWIRKSLARPSGGAILANGPALRNDREAIFASLRDAWKRRGALSPLPAGEIEAKRGKYVPEMEPYADDQEMIAIAYFEIGGARNLNIVYPARCLEPVMKALS
jgi:flagellar motor switch/type III secretory pathway protein FliN